ncbi:MAG: class I SAM-dependent methyltransferase [Acidimicrobiia bacterium]|nr:class I SAM-dependent methyltransferase [Acidimicrobiia bacterium]
MTTWEPSAALLDELATAQRLGLIGPRALDDHIRHAVGFATACGPAPGRAADLGSGGGLPALVLAEMWPSTSWTLIERRDRAAGRLDVMIGRLGCHDRITVHSGDAEVVGRDPGRRGAYDLVTARGFGPPATTAECGAPLLRVGGLIVVSEPPSADDRWPAAGLARLGLRRTSEPEDTYFVAEKHEATPERYPRRVGRPRSRPLWEAPS